MIVESAEDLEKLKVIGKIVANCLVEMQAAAVDGMSTYDLDQLAVTYFLDHGVRSAPMLCYDFPGATCISLGHEVAHGVPNKKKFLAAGDLINIDVSAEKDGYFGDTGGSFIVRDSLTIKAETQNSLKLLLQATQSALSAAIAVARDGVLINEIGRAVETVAKKAGFTVIRNLGSHGVGRSLHEEPKFIAGYCNLKDKRVLKENQVITIEPFLSTGADWVEEAKDGWTLFAPRHIRSAQFEHTMMIRKDAPPLIFTESDVSIKLV